MGALVLLAGWYLMDLTRPLIGPFATKNVVYAMIARNWAEGRATLAYPTLDCLKGGQRSLHMLEFPVAAYLAGWGWNTCGGSLDVWGRAQAVAFSLASVVILFALVRRRHGPQAALVAATALACAPIAVLYGRAFMLEASLVCFLLGAFAALDRWRDGGAWIWLLLGCTSLALALLTKIYAVVFLLPLAVLFANPNATWRRLATAIGLLLALVPAGVWYVHAARTAAPGSPMAERVYYSVRDSAEVHRPPHPLLRSSGFYAHMLDDLSGVVLTPIGLGLCAVGFLNRAWRRYLAWLVAAGVLVVLLPRKFFEMNYYWMALLPGFCILIGLGGQVLAEHRVLGRRAALGLLGLMLLFNLRYTAGPRWSTSADDRGVLAAGAAVAQHVPPDAPVITIHGSGIDLLYYCQRPGWALDGQARDLIDQIASCRREGARHLAIAGVAKRITLPQGIAGRELAAGDGFALFELTP